MKIVTDVPLFSPAPNFDHIAYDDSIYPDGPVGHGRTPLEALQILLEFVDGDEATEAAVQAKIDELTEIVGAPV